MDDRLYFLGIAIPLLILFAVRSRKKASIINQKRIQLKSLYKHEAFFLCNAADDLGNDLIQFYGEPHGGSVRGGMKISDPSGAEYTIKEVYANDKTPDKSDFEIPNGVMNTAIVIETKNFNWQNFRQNLKNEKVVALKLR